METPAKIAVIGGGYWGKNLVRNFHDIGVLELICDKNETLLAQYKKQYPGIDTCLALNEVLTREDIDGVVISTPAETHYTLAREVLMAGKHVFVEKPLVLEEEHGEELLQLANDRSRILMVGHLLQYHPAFIRLKELISAGELGRINYIYSNRLNLGKIRREENILWSFAPHDISMILSLAGEFPEKVVATGGNYLHRRIADVTTTHLTFPSGLRAHIFVSWLHPFKEQKLIVVGDRQMAVFDDTQPWKDKILLYPHRIEWHNNVPVPEKAEPGRVKLHQSEPLRNECEHYLNCIQTNQKPRTDGREGLEVLKILKSAQRCLDNKEAFKVQPKAATESTSLPQNYFYHPTAIIDEDVNIGQGTKIWHFSHVLNGSIIGEDCTIGQNVMIGPDVTIGNRCKLQNNVSVYKGVTLEDGVFCGPSMVFTNIYNPRAEIRKMDRVRPTLVRKGATLGANSTIVCGVTIGRYAFLGAGAVANKDISDHALVVGNPGNQIGWVCVCGERLNRDFKCLVCNQSYRKSKYGLELVKEQGIAQK